MGSNNLIVKEYLESLKEDSELDYLFPILLNLMGFRIISTPKDSKGQPQFGKDVIAVGKDSDGIKKRFYFELKGHAAKDIDDTVFNQPDGIRDSLLAAKDAKFADGSVPGFNELPLKFVLIHNGVLKSNTRPLFEGFISREFPDYNFERWDIHVLTDLFGKYLFSEYLLTDEESIRLFKRTLVLLDAPEYDFIDFKQLVDIQLSKTVNIKGRSFKKLFATLNLLSVIIVHYSKENDNLHPAKKCVTYLLLKSWHWILLKKLETRAPVIAEFNKLVAIHFNVLNLFFSKTLLIAKTENGLFSERGGPFESIGYPLRSFEYVNYLIYYFEARLSWPHFDKNPNKIKIRNLRFRQKESLKEVIRQNLGTKRPIIDGHLIGVLNVFLFFYRHDDITKQDKQFLAEYLNDLFGNILISYLQHKRFPELRNNITALTEFLASGIRPAEFEDRSSLLITILFELIVILNAPGIYKDYQKEIVNKINLQTAYTNLESEEFEVRLFEKSLHNEYYVETSIQLPDESKLFKDSIANKATPLRSYRTDNTGFHFLRILAHIYFENEFLPDEWRRYLT